MEAECNKTLPVSEKYMLTIKEAAAYFNIGIKRLHQRLARLQCCRSCRQHMLLGKRKGLM